MTDGRVGNAGSITTGRPGGQDSGLAQRGGFHRGESLPILKGPHPVAPATDE